MPTDLPSLDARIEEYIAPAFDLFNNSHLNWSLDHYSDTDYLKEPHVMVLKIVQKAVSIGTYEN